MKRRLEWNEIGVEHLLASKLVDGIGKVYAQKLIKKYGRNVVALLRDKPEEITGISGLSLNRVIKASESIGAIKDSLELLLFLFSCEIPEIFIDRILYKYKKKTESVLSDDPYQMIEDVWRLSFFIADRIGKMLGIPEDDSRRLRGAVLTAIKHYAENGHLFAKPEDAVKYASQISGVNEEKFENIVESLIEDKKVIESRGGLYLPVYYNAERNGAKRLIVLASAKTMIKKELSLPTHDIKGNIYTEQQREAIKLAIENPVIVLTGGPGTGKTTVLKGILDYFGRENLKCVLTAPTGRAAKRISVLTGHEASTIHHLLGYREGEGYHNKTIEADLLVIDESSMLEQVLFDHLLESLTPGTRIIIIGDVDQLPAIGAGDVLRELIKSGTVPVAKLNENFRQMPGSQIAKNAVAINKGIIPVPDNEENFMIINESGIKSIHDRVLSLVSKELPEKYSISPMDIQVVTPQQMGPLGARQLNKDLQALLNGDSPGIKRVSNIIRLGDPVMQTANSRERGLFNGEIGKIVEVDPEERLLVAEFSGGRRSTYQRTELSELALAYATTVHKLQGSEVDYMVMPLSMSHRPMLYRKLLYTGVSRARELCVLVGEQEALEYAITNNQASFRNTNLSSRLKSLQASD